MDTNTTSGAAAEEPKKYIRTLASDMEALKKGGAPGFKPLAAHAPEPEPETEVPLPAPPEFSPPPEPDSAAPMPVLAPKMTFEPPPPLEPAPPPLPPPEEPEPPPPPAPSIQPKQAAPAPLETYTSDFSERMEQTNASTATVLAAEEDARTTPVSADEAPRSRGGAFYALGGAGLLIVGGLGIYFAYARYATNTQPVALAPTVSAPIFVDDRVQVSGAGSALMQAVEQSVATTLTTGAVRLLYLPATTTPVSVFVALKLPAPDILERNVSAAGSMAGVVNAGGTQSPFFILSVDSYRDTFAGMLSWEPSMPGDLAQLFPSYPTQAAATTTATSTVAKAPAGSSAFRDEVIANHDVRAYVDGAGRTVLLYGYWDDRTLVIARDQAAFTEIVQRLASSRSQ
ncbi:MAG TPA: hypothetical protein VMV50_00370 [Candidatus Paceibacterota bacterium]|nr:hypothetical protein [Candidatus Paceibacterota bacterium]